MTMKAAPKTATIFAGTRSGLDFSEMRNSVLRIPEVTIRIREAQAILDSMEVPRVDLFNVISSDDETFNRNAKLKSLLAAIVQIGLFDRYMKTNRRPEFMVGAATGDSAMNVCAGLSTFGDMVIASQAIGTLELAIERAAVVVPLFAPLAAVEAAPLVEGRSSVTEYRALQLQSAVCASGAEVCYATVRAEEHSEVATDIKKLVTTLYHELGATRFVSVGPGAAMGSQDFELALGSEEVESLDSIEIDPMLSWFWRSNRRAQFAIAQ